MVEMQNVKQLESPCQFPKIGAGNIDHLRKIFHVAKARLRFGSVTPAGMVIDDSSGEMGDFCDQVQAVFPIIFAALEHAEDEKCGAKEFHRMSLTGQFLDGFDHLGFAGGPLLQLIAKLLDLLWGTFLSIIEQIDHLDRIPIGQLRDRFVDVKKTLLRIDIRGRTVADGKSPHAGLQLVFRDLEQHFFRHILTFE